MLQNCCAVSYFGETFSRLLKDTPELEALQMEYTELETRHNQLLYQVYGPNGLRAKGAHYDMVIAQSYTNIASLAASEQASTTFEYPAPRFSQQLASYAISNLAPAQTVPSSNPGVLREEVVDDQPEFQAEAAFRIVQDNPNSDSSKAPQPAVQPYEEEDAADMTSEILQAVDKGRAISTPAKRTSELDVISQSWKRPRVEPNRVSALVQGMLLATKSNCAYQS